MNGASRGVQEFGRELLVGRHRRPVAALALDGQLLQALREAALDRELPLMNIYLARAVLVEHFQRLLEARGPREELEVRLAAGLEELDHFLRVERKW